MTIKKGQREMKRENINKKIKIIIQGKKKEIIKMK